ncbi:MAG: Fe-S-cluster oxidoreductase [Opitutaceae bacterium]|jgi:hypothetical protein
MPGMPRGKPAGVPCLHLLPDFRCALFGHPERPTFCDGLQPSTEMCGTCRADALTYLESLERATRAD